MQITLRTCFVLAASVCLIVNGLWAQAPNTFNSRGIGGGGALFSPSINPFNHNEIYIGCDMSDLFYSSNQGQDWACQNFSQVQGGHESYVSFSDTTIRYSVSYPSPDGNDEILPLKSTDGGQTWNVLSGSPYPSAPNGGILRLIADYNNPNHVMIADYGTIYFSQDGGSSFHQIHTCLSNGAAAITLPAYFLIAAIFTLALTMVCFIQLMAALPLIVYPRLVFLIPPICFHLPEPGRTAKCALPV
jgi:photosystem II stability/assembly factor-like uncharacterized protein